jgi:hypothetical protein|tara:strand:+ start:660 stop:923 length:264 start_codon:yes stop_codon:yes gene_type:complete
MAPARKRRTSIKGPEWSDKDMIAYNWCINNGVKISPRACKSDRDNYYWWIDVEVNGAKRRSPITYNGKELNNKIFELYRFYYDKNKL